MYPSIGKFGGISQRDDDLFVNSELRLIERKTALLILTSFAGEK